ncbi:MAG: glycoside-pentoside-hexuronide (GPH):cation symporter [Cellulosilyticaceae bacterium]|uniref:MFS transporter n=1 Tax=Niameybacter sp. TaxID=2033640 RepID=UPI002FCA0549
MSNAAVQTAKGAPKIKTSTGVVTTKEMLGHALGGVGQNTIFALWSGYMMMFYTDVFGLTAGFVGALFFGARVWDAINDPMMGVLADRTKTKHGRFRPWLLFMPVPVAICLVLNFTVPNLSGNMAMVYATITYIMMSMAFTAVDIPYWSMPAAMTSDPNVRTKIFAFSNMGTNLASTVAGATIVPMISMFGGDDMKKGFFWTAVTFGIIGCLLYWTCFKLVKEHVPATTEKFSFKLAMKSLATNKPLMLVMITGLVTNLAFIVKSTLGPYYTRYTLGDMGIMSILAMCSLPCIIIGTLLAPMLCKKFGKKRSLIGLNVCGLIVGILYFFFANATIPLVIVFTALQTMVVGGAMVIITSMTADTIEYAEWKTGQRNEGVITSTRTLITKFGMAITGVAVSTVLVVVNYQPNVDQTIQTMTAFHSIASVVPAVVMMIGCIPLYFYDLTEEKHAEIMREIEARKNRR